MRPFNNLDQSASNKEYMKLTKAGHVNDIVKTTLPPPVAMPSRKRLQPQTKSKFNIILLIPLLIQCSDITETVLFIQCKIL